MAAADEVFDIAIVGFGPCGAVAAGLLGGMGLKVWACDKSTTIYDKPRAFALDHEIMRVFQQLGVHERVMEQAEPFTPSEFVGVDGQLIKRFSTAAPPFPLAFPPALVFNQPHCERVLREHVATLANVQVALGCELVRMTQNENAVALAVRHADGREDTVRARYAIGCDGASSTVRTQAGIALKDLGFDQPWLVVDVMVTPEGAARLPQVSMQFCEPARPTTYLIGPGLHRRWEISINEGEDPKEVATPEGAWRLLSRWIGPDQATLWRQASYRFHALVADTWRAGRVFVAGDAAHQQPPFLGQGMCQGVRDVANLSWKLEAVLRGHASDALLDTYGQERRAHVEALTTRIKGIGQLIGERDVHKARARDAQLLAECGGVVQSVPRADVQPPIGAGLLGGASPPAGTPFPQPWLRTAAGTRRMDDVAGRGWRVVVGAQAPAALRTAAQALAAALPGGRCVALGTPGFEEQDSVAARWFERHGVHTAIVRPDHYVWGTAESTEALACAGRQIQVQLAPRTVREAMTTP